MPHPLVAKVRPAHPVLRYLTPVLLGILASLEPAPAEAQTFPLFPLLDEVRNNPFTGTTTASFGYINEEANTLHVSWSTINMFMPAPFFRGQPEVFEPGTFHNVFSLTFPSTQTVEWTLMDSKVKALAENGLTETYIQIDGAHSPAALTLFNGSTLRLEGGTFTTGTAAIRTGTTLAVAGGTFGASTLNSAGATTVTSGFVNTPAISNTGTFTLSGGTVTATTFTNTGGLRLNGGTLAVTNLSGAGLLDWRGGTIELATANLSTGGSGFFGSNPSLGPGQTLRLVAGTTTIGAGQFVNISPTATLSTQGGTNGGTLYLNGTLTSGAKFTNEIGGVINAGSATLNFTGDGVPNAIDGLQNLGELNVISATISGDVRSPAGSEVNVAVGVTFTGMFSGAGNFAGSGLATFQGGYSPGDSPALVTHDGSLAFGSGNVLTMEIAAPLRGTEYDALVVNDTLTFGGTLKLAILNGFTPQLGQTFDLFDWESASGTFSNFDLPNLDPALFWDMSELYTNGEITIAAVPEPSMGVLLAGAMALGATFCRTRRKRIEAKRS